LILLLLLAVAISLNILARLGVFRASTILGPQRLGGRDSPALLAYLLMCAVFLASALGGLFAHFSHLPQQSKLLAVNAAVHAAGIAALLSLNAATRTDAFNRLGLTLSLMPRAMGLAIGATALVLPLVYFAGGLVTLILIYLKLPEPPPHPVLQLLQKTHDRRLIAMLFVTASVLAPLAEELAFRAHIQTILASIFQRLVRPRVPPPPIPAWQTMAEQPVPVLDYAGPPAPPLPYHFIARWTAVAVTAALFALIHLEPAFMLPLFVLAIALGYVYERTGNLWACIFIHSLFNTSQMMIFLYTLR
jgi:membrane protease YdiL (CAAX protease family)